MPMSPRLLRPIASGVHPEAAAWRSAVVANGGSVSGSTMKAVSKFCADIDKAGIRDRFLRLNLFCGNSDASLNAARTPLYRAASRTATQLGNATDTSANFVQGDYAETSASGGLTGNGSNKRLATGLAGSQLNGHNIHLSVYEILPTTATFDASLGVRSNFSAPGATLWVGSPNTQYQLALHNNGISATASPGHWIGVQTGSVTGALYRNGVSESTTYTSGAATASDYSTISHDFGVFAHNDGGSPNVFRDFSATRLGGYSIGLSMNSTQAAAFYTAMQAFQTALGRNV